MLISILSSTARPLVANAEKIQPANNNNPPIEIRVCVLTLSKSGGESQQKKRDV